MKSKAQILHFDLFGKREDKYEFLNKNSITSIAWNKLEPNTPNFFFVKKDDSGLQEYENGFKIDEIFKTNSTGIKTHRDELVLDFSNKNLSNRIIEFFDLSIDENEIARKFTLKNNRDWSISNARKSTTFDLNKIKFIDYRPFDRRYCYYDTELIDFSREKVMQHFLLGQNIGLVMPKQIPEQEKSSSFITKLISGHKLCSAYNINNIFPLYLYPETNAQQTIEKSAERTPNLNPEIVEQIAGKLGLTYTKEKETTKGTFAPIDLLDYIYAVLHSPTYREKYKEFLKIDFPRVPYPKDKETFWRLVKLGGEIRQIHLLESPTVEKYITQYPVSGDNVVGKIRFEHTPDPSQEGKRGRVYINDTQYFANVPETAWNFYIGGYQPAQKWLKDRKERVLDFEDILHYQKIIVALSETDRLMKEIDTIEIE